MRGLMSIDDYLRQYRPNIGIALFNGAGKIWLGRRVHEFSNFTEFADKPNEWRWQMPQGGIDRGESYEAAAYRELKEETGASSARLLMITTGWLVYDFPAGYKKKDWKGQRQKWAVMLFEGEDSEFDLAADDNQEFEDWRWADLEETPGLIVPFKREVYTELVASLTPFRNYLRSGD